MALALEGTPVHINAAGVSSLSIPAFSTTNPAEVFITNTINSTTISSIAGGGLAWAQRTTANAASNPLAHWAAPSSGSLSSAVFTITYSGLATFTTADCYAFSGQDTSTIWDANASVPGFIDNGPDPILVSTNNANDVIIAGFRMGATPSPTAGAGFTLISGADFQGVEYQIVAATQTNLSCGLTTGTGGANGCIVDALMAAAAGAATSSAPLVPQTFGAPPLVGGMLAM